jgi:hypothetical protein
MNVFENSTAETLPSRMTTRWVDADCATDVDMPVARAPLARGPKNTANTGLPQSDRSYNRELVVHELANLETRGEDGLPITPRVAQIALALLDQTAAFWTGARMSDPHVSASPNGEVVLEWWSVVRKLTVYVGEDSRDYVQVWGPDIDRNMNDGEVRGGEELADLLRWLQRA